MKKAILLLLTMLQAAQLFAQDGDNTERLWYDKPATIWLEALPIGNGRPGIPARVVSGHQGYGRLLP